MAPGLSFKIVENDEDYLAIEIHAENKRFAGSTLVYTTHHGLSEFATRIAGFPASAQDERTFEFGSRKASIAGGFSLFRFHCVDGAGHAAVELFLEDDCPWYPQGTCLLTFRMDPAALDRFIQELHQIERECSGEAVLPPAA